MKLMHSGLHSLLRRYAYWPVQLGTRITPNTSVSTKKLHHPARLLGKESLQRELLSLSSLRLSLSSTMYATQGQKTASDLEVHFADQLVGVLVDCSF